MSDPDPIMCRNLDALIDGLLGGSINETYRKYYAHDVTITESGGAGGVVVGKAANASYYQFVNGGLAAHAKLARLTVDRGTAPIEWLIDTPARNGKKCSLRFVTLQTWERGRVVREDYSYRLDNEPTTDPMLTQVGPMGRQVVAG